MGRPKGTAVTRRQGTTAPIHAARFGLPGNHRTDGLRCPCDPYQFVDLNEPGRAVIVHRPMLPAPDRVSLGRSRDPGPEAA